MWEGGLRPSGHASGVSRSGARYDRATIDAILDEGLVCHLGFVHDGHPFVIPTLYAPHRDKVLRPRLLGEPDAADARRAASTRA